MSFWHNDGFGGQTEPRRSNRVGALSGKWKRNWMLPSFITLFLISIIVVLFLPFVINNGDGQSVGGEQPSFNEKVIRAADRVKPSVVSVINLTEEKIIGQESYNLGSGIIFNIQGNKAWIVTNQHVVDGANTLEVVLFDGDKRKAELIGSDRVTDLAVLQIDGKGIRTAAKLGDSDKLKAGESAIAIGNPLGLGYSQTITAGIISIPLRTIPVSMNRDGQIDWEIDLIQTDAAINRGNSGGALANLDGEVIGINSLKVSDFGVEGLGFAIPSSQAIPIIESLLEYGKVRRPYIGVVTQDLSSFLEGSESLQLPDHVEQGVIVLEAVGPAEEAGLKTSDLIYRLDERDIDSTLTLRKYLYREKEIGDDVKISFYRQGKKQTVILKLAEREAE